MKRYLCPYCGYKTLDIPRGESFEICEVCFWQNDAYQLSNPDDEAGPNRVSLKQAQKNFMDFVACEREMLQHVRAPLPGEERDFNWKFLAE